MSSPTLDLLSFSTVPSNYSWDKGSPLVEFFDIVTTGDSEEELIGFAPFCSLSIVSQPGTPQLSSVAYRRTVDFGDFYNHETNISHSVSLSTENFCHNYIMPGTYKVQLWAEDFVRTPLASNIQPDIACLERYCIAWSWKNLDCSDPEFDPNVPVISWQATEPENQYEKTWAYEPCDAFSSENLGTYFQPVDRIDLESQLSWQWYNFLCSQDDQNNWNNLKFQAPRSRTWFDYAGPCIDTSGWNDKQVVWKWDYLLCNPVDTFNSQIKWDELRCDVNTGQTWDSMSEACATGITSTVIETARHEALNTLTIKVVEIPPQAFLTVEQTDPTKQTPYTVRLSARFTKCGSFPIEKIVWDPGDGSPLIEQKRWNVNTEPFFAYNDVYNLDYEDPRNFDLVHTYVRKDSADFTFYPSITAFASNTNTSDCCSAIIGPIRGRDPSSIAGSTELVQTYLTDEGTSGFVLNINDTVAIITPQ